MTSGSGTSTKDAILESLNDRQRAAVEKTDGPVLILAGAGSGKTRVLVHRIAWLVQVQGVAPYNILAYTFTNKAAAEMKDRIAALLGGPASSLWVGTFHSVCVRILRVSGKHCGLDSSFAIYDSDDQEAIVREIIKDQGLGDKEFRPRAVLSQISNAKNKMLTPDAFEKNCQSYYDEIIARIYAAYQTRLRRNGALDFDDLISETVRLLAENEEVREQYGRRFRYVHVDEYQDTNGSQYELIRHLSSTHRNLCVVGDDDQSIYGWRGADIGNILSFESTFPDAFVVRLEQNYRSTSNILDAANALVKNNRDRKEKSLWTERKGGDPLRFTLVRDEEDEGQLIVQQLTRAVHDAGTTLRQLAVLYRTNAQSRAIENALRRAAIPYELIGGVPFYQRREVKDLLAYLRLAVNEADDLAFRRVLNVPKRGLGKVTLDRLAGLAFREGVSMLGAARRCEREVEISASIRGKILRFVDIVVGVGKRLEEPVGDVLMGLIDAIDYGQYLMESDPETASDRRENIEELIVGARQFSERAPEPTVAAFLNEVALLTDADRVDESVEKVRLMTAHNAKGLEFDTVFIAGLEEGLLPHASSSLDDAGLEEERRLFYVALTRARHRVYLSAATARRRFGLTGPSGLSRFMNELPEELLETDDRTRYASDAPTRSSGSYRSRRPGGAGRYTSSRAQSSPKVDSTPRHVLGKVVHPTFGRGEVVGQEGTGPDARLTVIFSGGVTKKIVARYAQWEESDVDF